jgi:hypothetical protein
MLTKTQKLTNMRTKKILSLAFASLTAVAVTFTACKEDAPEEPLLTVAPTAITATAEGKTEDLTVTANTNWTATVTPTEAAAWCTLDKSSGATNATVKVTIVANTTTNQRTATITFSGSDVKSTAVTVTQSAAAVVLSATGVDVTDIAVAGGNATINVISNVDWTAESNQNWVTITSGNTGSNDGTIALNIGENTTIESRSATVTVSASGVEPQMVNITQQALAPALSLNPSTIPDVSATGDNTKTIAVTSNTNWTATSNQSWVTITSGNTGSNDGTIALNISANTVTESRSATVTVSASGVESQMVSITQQAVAPTLSLNPSTIPNVSADGDNTKTIAVTSNTNWTATSNQSWVTITSGNAGSSNGTIALNIGANTATESRSATVTASASGVESQMVSITQASAIPPVIINVNTPSISAVPAVATDENTQTRYTITFDATTAWNAAVTGESWFHIDGNNSGAAGTGQALTIVIDYFKGSNTLSSAVHFTASGGGGNSDYDVIVTDNYASAAVVDYDHYDNSPRSWAPTDVLDPGQFAPVIKLRGKAYQWNRNIGYTVPVGLAGNAPVPLPNGMSSWPTADEFSFNGITYPEYVEGQSWTETPCPSGWSQPNHQIILGLIPDGGDINNDIGGVVKYWTNTKCPGLFFPAAGEIRNNGTYDMPGSGNPRYSMWGTDENSANYGTQGKRRRMDSNNSENALKETGGYVRCYKN